MIYAVRVNLFERSDKGSSLYRRKVSTTMLPCLDLHDAGTLCSELSRDTNRQCVVVACFHVSGMGRMNVPVDDLPCMVQELREALEHVSIDKDETYDKRAK